ncbi:armadillo-type protein [Coniella lustricola]|uniref:Armadillo-type protein n=1 Tax=Coniella lustricola TaxID=2025994 RepID=A0A2T3ABA7_9PEZI|nr:armadillo-type protein [Coniella lustricola]
MDQQLGPRSEFTSSARNQFFAKLKPVCVEISRFALQGQQQTPDKTKRALELLEQLDGILEHQIQYDASALDDKIADYVFFPLSHLLRQHENYPFRLVETVIKLLRLLIQYGWKARISRDLSHQLLILLTFLIGGVPGKATSRSAKPEETTLEAYRALTALVKAAGLSARDSPLTDAKIIPSLGHSVSIILDGVTDGSTIDIQVEALQAILAIYTTIKQDAILATFFPGTVSSLSRLLSPPLSIKAPRRLLVGGLNVLRLILTKVLGDLKTRNLLPKKDKLVAESTEPSPDEQGEGKVLTSAWLKATVAQVKIALSSILKLRTHEGVDVHRALEKLCITLLDECHSALSDSTSMLVESAMVLRESQDVQDAGFNAPYIGEDELLFYGTSLQDLATIYPELKDAVNVTVYNWVTSLPRVMQSSDERVKQQAIRNITKSQELLSALGTESSSLEDVLSSALRDSITALVINSKEAKVMNEVDLDENIWRSSELTSYGGQETQGYRPTLLAQESQRDTRREIDTLIRNIGTAQQQAKLAAEMLPYLHNSQGVDQVSSYWLAFRLVQSSLNKTRDIDDFLDFSDALHDPASQDQESVFDELYSFSVSILDAHSDANDIVDWRMEAIALEVTAFAAARMGQAFRPELIDVLYPISTFLGSARPELRGHALITLNSLAVSCGYGSVSELVIDNVDYMVNSVSLRLNQFDISPASCKVLTMMIRLTGPQLLPYLDDVVAGIFAALDNYHGYPAFVENLFAVLSEVVDQGVKSGKMLLDNGQIKAVHHEKRSLESSGLEDASKFLQKHAKKKRELEEEESVEEVAYGHPQTAWKSAKEELDSIQARDEDGDQDEEAQNGEEVAIPKTPTYTLLAKITTLTQHYLTSPTPRLRKQLLDLLSKAAPALAQDENAFLPLVNDLWPVMITRLYDAEPYVVIAACETLSALCEGAGDFLSTRLKTEWWDSMRKWCFKAKSDMKRIKSQGAAAKFKGTTSENSGGILIPIHNGAHNDDLQLEISSSRSVPTSTGLGRFASAAQTWEAVVSMLVAIVSFVKIDDEIFEEILDLLVDDVLPRNRKARETLENVNADAVWLALYVRGHVVEPAITPAMDGVAFTPLADTAS